MTDVKKIREIKASRPLKLIDIILMSLVLVIALAWAIIPYFSSPAGNTVQITVNGQMSEYSLDSNRKIQLDGLTVVIENGQVFVSETDCDDKVCQHTGKISKVNQSIVCLPKNIVIKVTGKNDFQVDSGGGV